MKAGNFDTHIGTNYIIANETAPALVVGEVWNAEPQLLTRLLQIGNYVATPLWFARWRIPNFARDIGACYLIATETVPTFVVEAGGSAKSHLLSQILSVEYW